MSLALVLDQVAAYNARDVDRFLATYHPDTVITLANGTEMMRGHDAMRDAGSATRVPRPLEVRGALP